MGERRRTGLERDASQLWRRAGRWAAYALVGVLAACGGGGGGGGGGPTQPQPGVSFSPTSTAGSDSISLSGAGNTTATTFTLTVDANQVTDLYGVGFDLSYPQSVLSFQQAVEGTVLNAGGGTQTSLQVAEASNGDLVVGLSRLGSVGGFSGSGTLLTLKFAITAGGSGNIDFSANRAYDSNGSPIDNMQWVGGTLQVTQ